MSSSGSGSEYYSASSDDDDEGIIPILTDSAPPSQQPDEKPTEEEEIPEEDQGDVAPEPAFEPKLEEDEPGKDISPEFRAKHPLFDAPDIIDEHDELNAEKKLSDDEDDVQPLATNGLQEDQALEQENASPLLFSQPEDASPLSMEEPSFLTGGESQEGIPEWRKFTLPQTPLPDDSKIDAEILEQFSIPKLLNLIREAT